MPLIEIVTDSKSKSQLNKMINKKIIDDCEVIYIKDKNIENTKNIKLETLIINSKIENYEILNKILGNAKNVIVNIDLNEDIRKDKNIITYGYSSKSDITISSVEENQILICIQNTIISKYNRKIDPQEVKVNIKSDTNIYNIMLIIALTILYTR